MARKFRDARQMNKLTVVEAAEKLGVKQPSLSAWENGSRTPTVENLIAMAELYSVTTDYLLGRASEPQSREAVRSLLRSFVSGIASRSGANATVGCW